MSVDLEERLVSVVRTSAAVMTVLRAIRALDPPDWLLFSGAVYQTVWNERTGRPLDYGIADFDVGYFDADTSWDAEDAWIRRCACALPPTLAECVQVRNQARVHLWFQDRFGEPYEPLTSTSHALERFVSPTFAVGIRLEGDERIRVFAPFGLEDVFTLVVRPNPARSLSNSWEKVTASVRARWPEATIRSP